MPTVAPTRPTRELTLFDAASLIVGIIIGVGIYQMAPSIARSVDSGWGVLGLWAVGGLLSLCGALGYAELASAYPRAGGDYVYLTRAYGRWAGFLFGWIQLAIVRPGDIAVMAFAFAMYAAAMTEPLMGEAAPLLLRAYACGAVVILTLINIVGVHAGKWTQNLLTLVKAAGLLGIVLVAFASPHAPVPIEIPEKLPLSLGLVFVLFSFGGWNEMAYVAGEVKEPQRNIVRALVYGTGAVTLLYLLVNGAFLYALGYPAMAASEAVATETISTMFPQIGGRVISLLVCLSALGAVNGLVFTGARISYAAGADHRAFRILGRWHSGTGTPVPALALQGTIAVVLIIVLGSFIDTVVYTAAPVYLFYLATSVAVVVLRRKSPDLHRPYRVTAYPFPTIVFSAACAFLIYSTLTYAWSTKPWIVPSLAVILCAGLLLYRLTTTPAGPGPAGERDAGA